MSQNQVQGQLHFFLHKSVMRVVVEKSLTHLHKISARLQCDFALCCEHLRNMLSNMTQSF